MRVGAVALACAIGLGIGATLQVMPSTAPSAPPASQQPPKVALDDAPNVLVIETDDMRSDELRFMPNVEKFIARRGLNFRNSFAPNPLCCPSRTSFLTGEYSHNHRVLSHFSPYGFQAFNDADTLATRLQDAGYRTALIGKYLNGYGNQHVFGTKEPSLNYVPPGWDQWMAGVEYPFPKGSTLAGGTYNYMSMTLNVNGNVVGNRGVYSSDMTARRTRAVVDGFEAEKLPWFVWWTPVAPHFGMPIEPDDPRNVVRPDGQVRPMDTPARPEWVRGKFDKQIKHGFGVRADGTTETDIQDKPRFMQKLELTPSELRAVRTNSRQCAESLYALDKQIGVTIEHLKSIGALDNTYLVFTSDNGYFLGEHRKRGGKILSHEPSLRVPLLIAGPGVPVGERFDPAMTIDLAPTISTWAGAEIPRSCDGMPLQSAINHDSGWNRVVLTEGLVEALEEPLGLPSFPSGLSITGIRVNRWAYFRYGSGAAEMYDLKVDPLEMQNLYKDPAYADVRRQLQDVWTRYQMCQGRECRIPLPDELRATPEEARELVDYQDARTQAYYE